MNLSPSAHTPTTHPTTPPHTPTPPPVPCTMAWRSRGAKHSEKPLQLAWEMATVGGNGAQLPSTARVGQVEMITMVEAGGGKFKTIKKEKSSIAWLLGKGMAVVSPSFCSRQQLSQCKELRKKQRTEKGSKRKKKRKGDDLKIFSFHPGKLSPSISLALTLHLSHTALPHTLPLSSIPLLMAIKGAEN